MSSSDFARHLVHGDCPFVAIPVFVSRVFRHGHIAVNRKAIGAPKDLAGKRIGVPLYGMTAAIFIRGLLQHDHGVDLSGVQWVEGGLNDTKPHGHPTSIAARASRSRSIPAPAARSLNDLLEAGEIVATIGSGLPKAVKTNPDIVRLFPDYREREKDYYRRTKIFPIMHLVVLRRDVYEKHPFVATALYNACCEAKARASKRCACTACCAICCRGWRPRSRRSTRSSAAIPGPTASTRTARRSTALVQYLADQELIAKPVPIECLFVPTFGQARQTLSFPQRRRDMKGDELRPMSDAPHPAPPATLMPLRALRWRTALDRLLVLALIVALWQAGSLMVRHLLAQLALGERSRASSRRSSTANSSATPAIRSARPPPGRFIGGVPAVLLPFVLRRHPIIVAILDPFMVGGYGAPKLAFAPLFILWFGIGIESKIALVASVVFFIVYFATLAGVRALDAKLVQMAQIAGASERQVARHIVMPAAVPAIFAGFRIAVPYAIGAAVIAELISSNRGLGYLVQTGAMNFDTTSVFAAIVAATLVVLAADWLDDPARSAAAALAAADPRR